MTESENGRTKRKTAATDISLHFEVLQYLLPSSLLHSITMMSSSSRLLSLYQRTAAASLRSGTAVRCLSNPEEPFPIKEEYVHPLSQFVLQHLQQSRSDWVVKNGLDRGLTLQRDGTFELVFPSFPQDRARIW